MKLRCILVAMLCATPLLADAAIYKAVDADGHVTYSNTPIKGGKKIKLEPLPTMHTQRPRQTSSSEDFPKVTSETQKSRDDARRKILEEELNNEEKLLVEARQKLKLAEDTPQVYHKEGKTYRNMAKYQASVNDAQEDIKLHESNIEALKTELSNLR